MTDNARPPTNPFREMVDMMPALAWSSRSDGAADYFNRGWLEYTGLRADQALEWGWTAAIHPDDLESLLSHWRSVLATGGLAQIEARLRRSDGAYRWFLFRAQASPGGSGGDTRWFGTNIDIDDRKRAEVALAASESQLRLLVDTIPGLVSTMNANGDLETVNRQVVEYLGKSSSELQDWAFIGTVHQDDVAGVVARWRRSVATGEPYEIEHRIRRADGVFRWFHVRGVPLRDDAGHILRWYVLLTDVDDIRRTRLELDETREKLSRASRAATIAELSASIAHEINQPLAAIVTNGEAGKAWLANRPPEIERANASFERIVRDGHAAAEIVRNIKGLFKHAPPTKALSDLNHLLTETLRLAADDLREHGIVVSTSLADGLPAVAVDRTQIQHAVLNLVHNGIEAMQGIDDGARALAVRSGQKGRDVVIEIADRGCGVAEPRVVFDPFFTTKSSGMGMGLAITRSIVEGHGGRISCTPNGHGTTFTFTLPSVGAD